MPPSYFHVTSPPPPDLVETPSEGVGEEKQQCRLGPEGVFQPPELTALAKGAGIPDGILRPPWRGAGEAERYGGIYVREVICKWLPPRPHRRCGDDGSQRNSSDRELREDAASHLTRSPRKVSDASLPFVCFIATAVDYDITASDSLHAVYPRLISRCAVPVFRIALTVI